MDATEKQIASIWRWIVGGALVGIVAALATYGVRFYFFHKAIDNLNQTVEEVTSDMTARSLARQQQYQLEAARKAQQTFDQDTLCALNSDTNKCVCLHRNTGQIINVPQAECEQRAAQATDRL